MKKTILVALGVLAMTSVAQASVLLDPHLSGTGDNVISDLLGSTTALGHLNGPHLDVVDYTGLTAGFTGAANGNDIKIDNTNGLSIQVFDPTNTFVVGTTTQVFSLKGTGDVLLSVVASDGTFNFDLGTIDPHAQSGFTLSAIDGEVMTMLTLLDIGGSITEFEHNRIEIAAAATPIPPALMLFAGGLGVLMMFGRRRERKQARLPIPKLEINSGRTVSGDMM
jgi:hypothetical protein